MEQHVSQPKGLARRDFLKVGSILGLGAIAAACTPAAPPAATPAAAPTAQAPAAPKPATAPAATTAAASGQPKKGGEITILIGESILGLDLFKDGGFVARGVWHQLYNSLLDADIDRVIQPALASSLPETPDPTTFIFKLRQGVVFHDGTPFDADAVMWQYGTILADPKGWLGGLVTPYLKDVEKVDQHTVKLTTHAPSFDFLNFMGISHVFCFQSKAATEQLGKDYGFRGIAGTGPFKLDSFKSGEDLVMSRNEKYWNSNRPYLDKITFRTVGDASTRQLQLQAGAADVMYAVPASIVAALKSTEGITVESMAGGTQHYLSLLPYGDSPFGDKRVRQAMYYAINRQEIVDQVLLGQAAVATSIFPPSQFVADPTEMYPYSPEKAKQLLADAGYDSSRPLSFVVETANVFPWPDEAVLIQAQLAKVGVKMQIQQLENAALNKSLNEGPEAISRRQAALYRRGLDGFILNDYTYRPFHSKGGVNKYYNKEGGVMNPTTEKLLEEMAPITDREKLLPMAHKLNKLVLEDAPFVYLAYENNTIAYRNHVKGMKPWPASQLPLDGVWVDNA